MSDTQNFAHFEDETVGSSEFGTIDEAGALWQAEQMRGQYRAEIVKGSGRALRGLLRAITRRHGPVDAADPVLT